jgi:CRISPR/Cas system-associated exonuclease Cas4 (RecB family)
MTYSQEKFPIQDTRGILVYIKQDLKTVEVNIDQDFNHYLLEKAISNTF